MIRTILASSVCVACVCGCTTTRPSGHSEYDAKVEGLLLGSMIGDALGGPVEFVDVREFDRPGVPFRYWRSGEGLPNDLQRYVNETELMPYAVFRPKPEPYAHWYNNAPAGTLTDDSRHKAFAIALLADWVEQSGSRRASEVDLARVITKYSQRWRSDAALGPLAEEWLAEYLVATRWVLGERDTNHALPPSRLWGGLPTCAGQMLLPPIAGIAPGDPEAAYRFTYDVAFIDNGFARDMNAAIVAGLAEALVLDAQDPEAWSKIKRALRETDPYAYRRVPWVTRSVDRWLDYAIATAATANRQPAALRAALETDFADTTWWEAHVTFAMAFAAMELADYEPIASMRLAVELGRDTDSTAQIVGAFMGALHGPGVFPTRLSDPVRKLVAPELGYSLEECVSTITAARDTLAVQTK